MTMFTRNDNKTPDATPAASPPRDKVETPQQAYTETKRPQATVQPLAPSVPSPTSSVPGVSVISKALKITGQLESTEDIQIDGEVDGDVRGVSVKVGSNAKVKGTVYGEAVEVSGTVEGRIEAKRVVLTSTAHMSGDVVHQDIAIQSGAFIDGHCKPEYGKTDTRKVVSAAKPAA